MIFNRTINKISENKKGGNLFFSISIFTERSIEGGTALRRLFVSFLAYVACNIQFYVMNLPFISSFITLYS